MVCKGFQHTNKHVELKNVYGFRKVELRGYIFQKLLLAWKLQTSASLLYFNIDLIDLVFRSIQKTEEIECTIIQL